MQRRQALFLYLLGTALLAGCGFQLRGTGPGVAVPEEWRSMYLVTANPNSEFSREVIMRFAAHGVEWQENAADANYRVRLGPERFSQRNLSLNADARAAEFELTLRADFSVQDRDGREVLAESTATVVKQMENDPANVVGKAEEQRILKSEMRVELAQQILRRIAFFAAAQQT